VVVSVDVINERRKTVLVVPLSSLDRPGPPLLIPVVCAGRRAVAVTDQVRAVSKERLQSWIGVLADDEMAALEDGLRQIMNLG
jgi:mRNA-degrading endonuclease toxin of MazEF toxin-antitoxin module